MAPPQGSRADPLLRVALGALILTAIVCVLRPYPRGDLKPRVPGADRPAGESAEAVTSNPVLRGMLTRGPGQPADLPGAWPQFRGPNRNGISPDPTPLAREWPPSGPRQLWSIEVGEGYAGPAVLKGRVYLLDYDREMRQDALRCLSLADGRELWRFAYPVSVKRNHGMSRTVPTLASNRVVTLGPKCHVACLDATTGELKWGVDLVREFGATVPDWYAGQCPLIDQGAVILAPGGSNALVVALELETGKVRWQSPNPNGWQMTHSSLVSMEFAGRHQYVYCGSRGVSGVSTADGAILWETPDWKISIANVPSPLVLSEGRLFLCGGYNAGSLMLQLKEEGGQLVPRTLFRLKPDIFGATQHTPVLLHDHLFGVRPDGEFACLDLSGQTRWASGAKTRFGLGPFVIADGLVFALDDTAKLSLMEATPGAFRLLGQAQILKGHDAWGPMALAGSRLLLRDLTHLVCLEVGAGR
jgi:outer membrane protein assembly factor BamB